MTDGHGGVRADDRAARHGLPAVGGPAADTRGIVNPALGLRHWQLHRSEPSSVLQPYVDRFWCVSWDLPHGQVFDQPILAHPSVNIVVEPHRAAVYGVPSRIGSQRLTGSGWAVAAMFRPGGARPFLDAAARDWVDRVVDVGERWGAPAAQVVSAIRGVAIRGVAIRGVAIRGVPQDCEETQAAGSSVEAVRTELLEAFLAALAPPEVPPETTDAVGACRLIADDRGLCRVEDLALRSGIEVRSLQRLFAEQVGFTPKQVIRRYRLLEAAESVAGGDRVVWADVARQLGFSDQAHLTRDFKAAFGVSPARYAAG